MNKYIKVALFLIFICWVLSSVSGCAVPDESKRSSVSVEDINVKSSFEGNSKSSETSEKVLNVTACIINADKADSSALRIRFKLEETDSIEPPSYHEVATENVELDCIKGRSMLYQSVQIAVSGPGTYDVEVSVSEEGKSSSPSLGMVFFVGEEGEVGTF